MGEQYSLRGKTGGLKNENGDITISIVHWHWYIFNHCDMQSLVCICSSYSLYHCLLYFSGILSWPIGHRHFPPPLPPIKIVCPWTIYGRKMTPVHLVHLVYPRWSPRSQRAEKSYKQEAWCQASPTIPLHNGSIVSTPTSVNELNCRSSLSPSEVTDRWGWAGESQHRTSQIH